MTDNRNRNPIVMRGTCPVCGNEVALFERDADDYLANPIGGIVHFSCAERERRS